MRLTDEGDTLKRELYDWFFKWDGRLEKDEQTKAYNWVRDEKWRGEDYGDDGDENMHEEEKTDE